MTTAYAAGGKGMLYTAFLCMSTGLCAWVCVSVCTGKLRVLKHLCPQKRTFTIYVTLPIITVWKILWDIDSSSQVLLSPLEHRGYMLS